MLLTNMRVCAGLHARSFSHSCARAHAHAAQEVLLMRWWAGGSFKAGARDRFLPEHADGGAADRCTGRPPIGTALGR